MADRPEHCHRAHAGAPLPVILEASAVRPVCRWRATGVAIDADQTPAYAVFADHAEWRRELSIAGGFVDQGLNCHHIRLHTCLEASVHACIAGLLAIEEHVLWIDL